MAKLKQLKHTLVFYESPHRIGKTLDDICEVLGVRQMCLAREISKKFEEFLRGSTVEIRDRISSKPIKGEIVIIVAGDIE